jgi:pimeloyl-ACP methyl ester carboxylesterase
MQEQRWLLDGAIRTVGVEWDQPRLGSKIRAAGLEAEGDFRSAARKVRKFADIHHAFAAAARKREARARAAEAEGRIVAARESYMTAALLWTTAAWPIFEANETLLDYEERTNACYAGVMRHAPHPIARIDIPLGKQQMPAYLHLPRVPQKGERFAACILIGGMDSTKESLVSLYGDRLLSRGLACLALDGPGQAEAVTRGLFFTPSNFAEAGVAAFDFLKSHPAIDADRVVMRGVSFGSYFGTVAAAGLGDRIKGFAATGVCQEPGCHTIFEMASPTFKARFMFMSGFQDEKKFDRFRKGIDLRPFAPKITAPYLVIAGENDQLSPLAHTEDLFRRIKAPKRLVIFEGANHSVGDAPSVENGEEKNTLIADWLLDRIAGKKMRSERVWVDSRGEAHAAPFESGPVAPRPRSGRGRDPLRSNGRVRVRGGERPKS